MSRTPTPPTAESPARRFGREIAATQASGTEADGLVLHLTLTDASKVKRDADLPLNHVSFSPEGMRFMGVRVVQGGVSTSVLMRADESAALEAAQAPAPPAAKPAAKPRKTKAAAR